MSRFSEYLARRGGAAAEAPDASALDRKLRLTFFRDRFATTKAEEEASLRDLVTRIAATEAPNKAALPWLKLATFGDRKTDGGSLRNDANVLEVHGVEADYDGESVTLDKARQVMEQAGVAALLYTSPSHTPDRPRWRILCPTSRALPPDQRARMVARINGLFAGGLAAESFTLSQAYYFGRIAGNDAHAVALAGGRFLDECDELDIGAVGRPQPARAVAPAAATPRHTPTGEGTGYGRVALERECEAIRFAGDGSKHHAIVKAAYSIGGLVTAGELPEGEALGALRDALAAILPRCRDPRAAQKTLERSFREGMATPRAVPEPPPEPPLAPAVFTLTQKLKEWAKARQPAPLKPKEVPPDLMDVPGALGAFVTHCQRSAVSPQPFLALAAAICMVGALAGRRYRTTTDLRTNIYAVGVADSGGGKDHARREINRLLYAANLTQYLGGSDIASSAGLRTALARHPSMLFQIDEFGDWLADVLGDKAPSHRKRIASDLKELYSSANGPWRGTEYADQSRQGRPREDIHHPNACLYGTTTPGQFWAAVGSANLHDGLMARMLLFVSPCSYPDEQDPDLSPPAEDLVAALQAIAAGGAEGGNLAGLMLAGTVPEPLTVPETPEATEARRDLRRHQLAQQRRHEGTYVTSIAGRLAENAMKLALIRAVSRNPASPVIEAADVAWGRALAQHCMDTLLAEAGNHVADNDYEQKLNRALDYVRKHGPISMDGMFRKGWRLPERERREILNSLVEARLLIRIEVPTGPAGGRPTTRYAINHGLMEDAIETPQEAPEHAPSD